MTRGEEYEGHEEPLSGEDLRHIEHEKGFMKHDLRRQLREAARELRREGGTRDTVVACRVDAADLEVIDVLVESGIRTTRSDAAYWLIHEGVKANQGLIQDVRSTVEQIRRLREEAQTRARRYSGEQQPEGPTEPGGY